MREKSCTVVTGSDKEITTLVVPAWSERMSVVFKNTGDNAFTNFEVYAKGTENDPDWGGSIPLTNNPPVTDYEASLTTLAASGAAKLMLDCQGRRAFKFTCDTSGGTTVTVWWSTD